MVGLCCVEAFFLRSGTARVGGTAPIFSLATALTAFVALNVLRFFFGANVSLQQPASAFIMQ